jgi:hypothetical protein
MFENIIFGRLYHHIDCNHILVNEQFGFRNNQSTEIASYCLVNAILSSLNGKLLVGGVFFDLQSAIDCVNHDIILSKMEFYGISGKANKLIKSYLKGRYQRVLLKIILLHISLNGSQTWSPSRLNPWTCIPSLAH